jgi:hypothetical protein
MEPGPAAAPLPARPAIVADRLMPERLAMASVGDTVLAGKRGGVRVNGLDLSIGLQVETVVEGRFRLSSGFAMNDAGRWVAVKESPATSSTGDFRAVAGDPATTRVVHQLLANNVSSIISNRADNTRVDQAVRLDIGIDNLASFSNRMVASAGVNRLGADVARGRFR